MKKIFLLAFLMGFFVMGFSQKFAIIDTRYTLDKMPDYKAAQKQLDEIAAGWQKDIDSKLMGSSGSYLKAKADALRILHRSKEDKQAVDFQTQMQDQEHNLESIDKSFRSIRVRSSVLRYIECCRTRHKSKRRYSSKITWAYRNLLLILLNASSTVF